MTTKSKKIDFMGPVFRTPEVRLPDDVRSGMISLNVDGSEKQAGKSQTVNCHLPSLGDRIKRYMRTPNLAADHLHDPDLWDDEDYEAVFDEDDRPKISVHSEQYTEGLTKARQRYEDRKKAEVEERDKKLREENENFRKRVKEIMAEADIPNASDP